MNDDGNERSIEKSEIRRILIRSTNWIGDVAMTLPALEALRENFPASRIEVLAKPWVAPLLESHPAVDGVLSYEKGEGLLGIGGIVKTAGRLRELRYDMAILFQNAFEAALLARLGGLRYRIGYNSDGRGFLLTHGVKRTEQVRKVHQVEYYLNLLRTMGWDAETRDPRLYVSQRDAEAAETLLCSCGLDGGAGLVGVSPGAAFGPAKRWPAERFAAVADRAAEEWGVKIVILGGKGDREIGEKVASSMKRESVNLCGRTSLGEAMAVIDRLHLLVTNDSGLMHVGAALNVPLVAVFGSTNPVITGPRSPRARVVQHAADCAPCLKPECPGDFSCMLSIEPEHVWQEMQKLIASE